MIVKIMTGIFCSMVFLGNAGAMGESYEQALANSCENFAEAEGADPALDAFEETFEHFLHEEDEELVCNQDNKEIMTFRSTQSAPVWGPFIRNLASCAPGCKPVGFHAYRNQRKSCHYSGRALDVFGISCGGKTHYAISGGKYASMVQCMKRKMRVLYRNGPGRTSGHHDHAHFSLGCSVPGRPVYW